MTACVLAVASAVTARADWSELQKGLDEEATLAAVGRPIIASQSKSRVHATWTYDSGGYVLFELGRVAHWQAPKAAGGGASNLNAVAAMNAPVVAVAAPAATARTQRTAPKPAAPRRYVIVR